MRWSHRRLSSRMVTLLAAGSVMVALLGAPPVTASEHAVDATDDDASQASVTQGAEVFGPFTPTLSTVSLVDRSPVEGWSPGDPVIEIPRSNFRGEIGPPMEPANPTTWLVDPLLEVQEGVSRDPQRDLSVPDLNFVGQGFTGVNPPDTVGDVGSTYYVQMVNGAGGSEIAVYNKGDGVLQVGGFPLDNLWPNPAEPCATGNGDPIVLYDHFADRWLLSEFASVDEHLCVYVSQTGDVLTTFWNTYDFITPNFPDYPKYAVWPDAYYVSSNEQGGPAVYALDRTQMLAGNPATAQRFTTTSLAGFGFQALTPSDVDGATPPAGAPNYFIRHRDDEAHNPGSNDPTRDFLDLFEFSVDWATPANSTFTGTVLDSHHRDRLRVVRLPLV